MTAASETATFAVGCFWAAETAFRHLPGVLRTSVGFMGGRTDKPTYERVCIGNTGHAEVVQVVYDPEQLSYEHLLRQFWKCHDPTTWVKTNPDVASPYRSAIFYHSDRQAALAMAAKTAAQTSHTGTLATEITAAGPYTRADRAHQHYAEKQAERPGQ